MADGNDAKLDGACEVCHTRTAYHTNSGDEATHFDGKDCIACHPHFPPDADFFTAQLIGPQSHDTHLHAEKGPKLNECADCHDADNFSYFADGQSLAETTICDPCHSPDGAYDGVRDLNPTNPDSVAYGAKYNWQDGIYEESGDTLKPEKKGWCAGCHDNGASVINNVLAPNVMGDNTSYGYNITGHGEYAILCADCHDLTFLHTDGDARSYSAPADNYRDGYRLNEDIAVPRNVEVHPQAFRLCTKCHIYAEITGPHSNFRDDNTGTQFHELHLDWFLGVPVSDSDFDCPVTDCTDRDSGMTCINCHNVHGSSTRPMIRDGELISPPGTTDKVPALDFRWYKQDGSTPTTLLEESFYGSLVCGIVPDISVNHVCAGCHATGRLYYYRTPTESLYQCDMVPDSTVINRGGTLGFQANITSNHDKTGKVYFVTFLAPPPGSGYERYPRLDRKPPWLDLYHLTLEPGQTKSVHITHTIPAHWPLGTYIYHGLVGNPGPVIHDECQFAFEVVEP
jgi:hypothetical protein